MNSMWMIIAAVFVFMMQAGFLMIEAGSVRAKNSTNVAQKNVSDLIICLVCYALVGFGVMYGATIGGYIGTGGVRTALEDAGGWPTLLIFNLAFCSVVATIISGAVAERMRIGAYLISTAAIALFVYPVFGHWVWGIQSSPPILPFWPISDLSITQAELRFTHLGECMRWQPLCCWALGGDGSMRKGASCPLQVIVLFWPSRVR